MEGLSRLPQDRPWLLWVSFPGPHEPFDVPINWRGRFPRGRIHLCAPQNPDELARLAPADQLARKIERWPHGFRLKPCVTPGGLCDHLALLDAQLGVLLKALDRVRMLPKLLSLFAVIMENCSAIGVFYLRDVFLRGLYEVCSCIARPSHVPLGDVCALSGSELLVSLSCYGVQLNVCVTQELAALVLVFVACLRR